jgi:hypothetical protein
MTVVGWTVGLDASCLTWHLSIHEYRFTLDNHFGLQMPNLNRCRDGADTCVGNVSGLGALSSPSPRRSIACASCRSRRGTHRSARLWDRCAEAPKYGQSPLLPDPP